MKIFKVYIAGPMRGYPEFNRPAFDHAEKVLKARGFEVWNPGKDFSGLDPKLDCATAPDYSPNATAQYMKRDLPNVLSCDAVGVLEGWEKSAGARIEVHVARECGLLIFDAITGKTL